MQVRYSKWLVVLSIVATVIIILYSTGRKSVHSEIVIEVKPNVIWDILMDEKAYPTWNNVLYPVKGEIAQGNKLNYQLVPPNGEIIEVTMNVKALIPNKLLNQNGGVPGLFTYNHRYILEQLDGKTRVVIHEDFNGIGVHFIDLEWIQDSYSTLISSLRKHSLGLAKQEK
ncbi:MAG: hypothetical protein NXI20_25580 [bacterium]|nr:hypothetical protein [bacterium]